jgi:hypothetical protein
MAYASTYPPSRKANRWWGSSTSNPNFSYRATPMSFQRTKRFGAPFRALICEGGGEQLRNCDRLQIGSGHALILRELNGACVAHLTAVWETRRGPNRLWRLPLQGLAMVGLDVAVCA